MINIFSASRAARSIVNSSLLLLLVFSMRDAGAVVVENLYDVAFPVPDQSSQVRTAVFKKGLEQVLIRASGSRSILQDIDPGPASAYVQQFRYVEDTEDEKAAAASRSRASTSATDWYSLEIQYNAGKIINLLRENAQPVWGEHRNEAIVWLAVRDGSNRYVLKQNDASLLKESVEQSAKRRGLPLVWPVYDSRDRKQLPFADVWAAFGEPIKQASRRYTKGPAIVGRLSWTGSEWRGDWSLFVESSAYNWSLSGSDYNTVIAEGIDLSADRIGKHYAVLDRSGGGDPDLLVEIRNIDSVQAYRKVQTFFEDLTAVRQVRLAGLDQGNVLFLVDLRGNIDDFVRLVSTDKTLQPFVDAVQPGAVPGQQTILRYSYKN